MNKSPTVLLVDDDAWIREAVSELLKEQLPQWQVVEASNGKEGVRLARTQQPDVIVFDYVMPVMNGHEMALALKALAETHTIPLVLCSSLGRSDLRIASLLDLCEAIIDKTAVFKYLASTLLQVTGNRGKMT